MHDIIRFSPSATIATISVANLARWASGTLSGFSSPLRLPPIQRSVVWRNNQILDYWDSLLRGFPPGMMMIQKAAGGTLARSVEGETGIQDTDGYQLFDGQQRLNAILIGLGLAIGRKTRPERQIWIELNPSDRQRQFSETRFALRMNSIGQPFGYRHDSPNEKFPIAKRREYHVSDEQKDASAFFDRIVTKGFGATLIDSCCAVPLEKFIMQVLEYDDLCYAGELKSAWREGGTLILEKADDDVLYEAMAAVNFAQKLEIPLFLLPASVLRHERDYIRFFERVGKGGTPLSEAELSYSIIKQRYPKVHDRVREVINQVGHWIDEVAVALATLRVAKALAAGEDIKSWDLRRPNPKDVQQLNFETDADPVVRSFKHLMPEHGDVNIICDAAEALRNALVFTREDNPRGLLPLALLQLDTNLLDCLILIAVKRLESVGAGPWSRHEREELIGFVLYWMLFVHSDEKAAQEVCLHIAQNANETNAIRPRALLGLLDNNVYRTRALPSADVLKALAGKIADRSPADGTWWEQFDFSRAEGCNPGAVRAIREISGNLSLCKFLLLWIQRAHLHKDLYGYDPTSGYDEDMPFDVDHLVPQSQWSFTWAEPWYKDGVPWSMHEKFRSQRKEIGNALGNLRYLTFWENRGRGDGPIGAELQLAHHLDDTSMNDEASLGPEGREAIAAPWNAIRPGNDASRGWTLEGIHRFQNLTEARAVRLLRLVLDEGGVFDLLPDPLIRSL
ncbi:DUF262 domain-containing protein [Xanthobacter agilis]|uniref:DUF262 domain-containing protein n=1 Tax=Xanthobacter agilis TaxID=47492 RepID=UPI00372B3AB5